MKRAVLAVLAAAGLVAQSTADELRSTARQLFGVIEAVAPGAADTPRAKLGQALFWDARLGADGRTACASCHAAADGSADRRALSPDARGKLTQRNSQPIFNSTLQPALRWTGDRRDAAAQAVGSLTGSMGFASLAAAEAHLAETGYAPLFRAAFPDTTEPLSAQHFGLFIERGCAACHNGPLLGGESFQKFGVLRDYWVETGATKIDEGRYLNTRDPADRFVFRVPMLRNITRTAPYFHDGSVPDLGAVVQIMARLQLGVELSAVETADLVAFLGALEGRDPVNYRPPQELPVSR